MDWKALEWRPFEGRLAASLAPHVGLIQSALEEAASAHVSAPITLRSVEVVDQAADGSPLDPLEFAPFATFELLAAPRRHAWVAVDPEVAGQLAGSTVEPVGFAGALALGVDEALLAVLGNGLGLKSGEDAAMPDSGTIAVRFTFGGPGDTGLGIVLAVEAAAADDLATQIDAMAEFNQGPAAMTSGIGVVTPPTPITAPRTAPVAAAPVAPTVVDAPNVHSATFDELSPRPIQPATTNIDMLLGVNLEVTVEIGRTRLPIREILALAPGSIVELDKLAGQPVDVLVNGRTIAQGEVVVVDENFGVRIMSIVSRTGRIASAGAA